MRIKKWACSFSYFSHYFCLFKKVLSSNLVITFTYLLSGTIYFPEEVHLLQFDVTKIPSSIFGTHVHKHIYTDETLRLIT